MTPFEVRPHVGAGPVLFGMTREAVRAVIREQPVIFTRGAPDGPAIAAYPEQALQVHYDRDGRVEFIERGRAPALRAVYRGHDLLAIAAQEAVDLLAQEAPFDPDDPERGYSSTFPARDLSLWRETLPEDEDAPDGRTFTTVGLGIPGSFLGLRP
jgi:hypothetical protein